VQTALAKKRSVLVTAFKADVAFDSSGRIRLHGLFHKGGRVELLSRGGIPISSQVRIGIP
jgi:hypothetical protein